MIADEAVSYKEDLEQQLEEGVHQIATAFASYSYSISQCLRDNGVTVENLCKFILSLPSFIHGSGHKEHTLLSCKQTKFEQSKSISQVFIILNCEYCNFLEFDILTKIVERFGLKLSEENAQYPKKFQDYIDKVKIAEFREVQCILTSPSSDMKKLELKLSIPPTSKLSQVFSITKAVAHAIGIERAAIRIHKFKKKEVVVSCYIPTPVANIVFHKDTSFSEDQKEEFRTHALQKLMCNGFTYEF